MLSRKLPKARRGRVSAAITRRIQKAISGGRLVPGKKLPAERDLAQRLEVSRVSVREAYRTLEELGLLEVKRGSEGGAFVADIDHEPVTRSLALMLRLGRTSLEELTEARLLLEPPIARLAARRAGAEDIERLEDLVRKQEEALKVNGNPRRYGLEFHRLIAQSAKNLPLMIVMNSVVDLTLEAISNIDVSDVKEPVIDFHRQLLTAIHARDEDAAYEIMRHHVLDVQTRLGKILARRRAPGKSRGRTAARVAPPATRKSTTGRRVSGR